MFKAKYSSRLDERTLRAVKIHPSKLARDDTVDESRCATMRLVFVITRRLSQKNCMPSSS